MIDPNDPTKRDQLSRDCLRQATRPNGLIDWGVYQLGLYGEKLFGDTSSGSSDNSGSDSDCVFLYATPGTYPKEDICREICPLQPLTSEFIREGTQSPAFDDSEMSNFADEVLRECSLYSEATVVNFLCSKLNISSTWNEEDVMVFSCDADKRVCDQEAEGALDESFLMYMVVLEEFGVQIPFTNFEMDVLKFLNVASS